MKYCCSKKKYFSGVDPARMLKEGCPVSTCLKMCPKIRLTVARLYPKIWPKNRFIFENLIETSFIILIPWNLYGKKLSLFCYEKKLVYGWNGKYTNWPTIILRMDHARYFVYWHLISVPLMDFKTFYYFPTIVEWKIK